MCRFADVLYRVHMLKKGNVRITISIYTIRPTNHLGWMRPPSYRLLLLRAYQSIYCVDLVALRISKRKPKSIAG